MPFPPSIDPNLDAPLSPKEKSLCEAAAAQGEVPPLGLVRRFVLTIRRNFSSNPKTVEKAKKSRTKPAQISPDQIDFF